MHLDFSRSRDGGFSGYEAENQPEAGGTRLLKSGVIVFYYEKSAG